MEQAYENQLRKEREEFDQKRAELSTRAAQRRQQFHEDAAAGSLDDVFTMDEDEDDGSRFF